MDVSPAMWSRLSALLDQALDLEPNDRQSWLERIGATDPDLVPTLRKLLAAHAAGEDDDPLATLPSLPAEPGGKPNHPNLGSGDHVGPYRLLRLVGGGGMADVWLASRDDGALAREVALKIPVATHLRRDLAVRFARERDILARLEHPHIARLYDAGLSADGVPYLAMEYVDGQPLTFFCDERRLHTGDRLRLFQQVLAAVQYAHAGLVLHRDLKPSNILVTSDGQVRLLDFGIAKLLGAEEGGPGTEVTRWGGRAFTPQYASPEQVSGEALTVGSDVYSLGVILFEILTGVRPYRLKLESSAQLEEAILSAEPLRPSSSVSVETAELRGGSVKRLRRELSGDLDAIVLRCLEKTPARRYGSVAELAGDLERCLRHEPVLARAPGLLYRAGKYFRRHRIGAGVAGTLLLLLVAFAASTAVQLRRITRERDRADRISAFMTSMFKVSDPSEARGSAVPAREILDRAARSIDGAGDPQLQAALMETMGEVYRNLGLLADSERMLTRSLELKRRELGPDDPRTLATTVQLAGTLADARRTSEAEKLLRSALEVQQRRLGKDDPATLRTMNVLATVIDDQGHYAEGEKLYREIIALQRKVLGPEHPETLTSTSNLALDLVDLGGAERLVEGEQLDRRVLEARRRILGPDHPDTLRSMANLAILLRKSGGHAVEAETLLREALAAQRRVLGEEHQDTMKSSGALFTVLLAAGKLPEAEALGRSQVALERRIHGPSHPGLFFTLNNLAAVLAAENKLSEAEQVLREALEGKQRTLGPDHPSTLRTRAGIATMVKEQGRWEEAEPMLREQLALQERVLGSESLDNLPVRYDLGTVLTKRGKLSEAEEELRAVLARAERALTPTDPQHGLFRYGWACLRARQGHRAEALEALRFALAHGLDPGTADSLATEPDLASLRPDPGFKALVSERLATKQGPAVRGPTVP